MDTKELIVQELESASEPILTEVLDFLRFLKNKQTELELQEDVKDALEAKAEAKRQGTISLKTFKQELGL
ncbi:MAG: hypothetical protein KME06_16460 [Kastovskya adunca ATA6-11-RM4]|jgi:hypothetical protein|nr:hypothetical protein [Kastovskya adunca ATA6-11-RM4]